MSYIVAVDGPAGAGKGTITTLVAKQLGIECIDTGALYRAVALEMINQTISLDEIQKIKELLEDIEIDIKTEGDIQHIFLNKQDITSRIRQKDVSEFVSPVSTVQEIRTKITELQRQLAGKKSVILEGRDIGTTVFPNADVKIYLDATPEERAKRRYMQNRENGTHMSYEEVLQSIIIRDKRDSTREIAPLQKAKDAIVVDSTNLTIEQVVEKIKDIILEKIKEG